MIYTIQETENGYQVLQNGNPFRGLDGQPVIKKSEAVAQKLVDRLNNPSPRPPQKQRKARVYDNRHRNWRRRRM